ncbi:hypothetical protein [Sneathiella sp.]|uniref:hypothetical protein n=1 Tax=Sneathiella sp. TaxID=1964365 RepID=UPI0039E52620
MTKSKVGTCNEYLSGVTSRVISASPVKYAANDNISDKEIAECLRRNQMPHGQKRMRRQDKRLWEAMTDCQFRSAQQLYYGFQMLVSGIGYRTQVFDTLPKGKLYIPDTRSDLIDRFTAWAKEARCEDISVGDILDILAFGHSCRDVDRLRARRKGYAKLNLIAGLDLFGGLVEINYKENSC